VPPYWGGAGQSAEYFAGGANFAVGGATALSPEFLLENGVPVAADTVHLDMEMDWFRDLLNLFCPNDLAGMVASLPSPSLAHYCLPRRTSEHSLLLLLRKL
jgi:hypothetical protein